MGRALARRLADEGDRLVLLGRDVEDLERSARDLEIRADEAVRGGADVGTFYCDLARQETFGPALDAAEAHLGGLDIVVVTAGVFAPHGVLEADPETARQVMDLDFTKTVLFCEEARKRLMAIGGGTLCVFSSVAGDRGRLSVGIYGAAKAGLSRYLEALDHGYRRQGLVVLDVRPGFVHTAMTAGLPAPPFAGRPEQVAEQVARAIRRGAPRVYTPGAWRWVMLIVRSLPRWIMRRLSF
jgi:NAD(P)-dependent dehydrogenase (short-subunit alcohol dehydrogenase family)